MSDQGEQHGIVMPNAGEQAALASEWRKLTWAATFVAILTSPLFFAVLFQVNGWGLFPSILLTFIAVIAFRGAVDVLVHKLIPRPSLYGAGKEIRKEDAIARRRVWYWRTKFRRLTYLVLAAGAAYAIFRLMLLMFGIDTQQLQDIMRTQGPQLFLLMFQLPLFFFFNFAILFGPMLVFGLRQMKGYEPGDADWGVRLEDVRGQKEPKEEVTRVISLWQAGEAFEQAGGKRERGLLFLGKPGTGKTMLSKAIATSFNSPIVTMPGSGFAQTFIGMDVIVVLFLIAKARRLARKWGGQCIVFIDEIDAVGLRRAALGGVGGMGGLGGGMGTDAALPASIHDWCFFGANGAVNPTGDLVLESRAWRDRLFDHRAPSRAPIYPPAIQRLGERIQGFVVPGGMGGMGGGGMALNQLLIQMDGVDEPPVIKKFLTNRFNTFLDATYLVPQRLGKLPLRLKPPRPRPEQIYFIGATNVPIDALDPALIRPGRMGRHIWFRTPTKDDRQDIFDLYIRRVAHDAELDTERKRDELARITNGYSPAMIEQVCSMALTFAHSDGRPHFEWRDIVEAMTTVESGTAQGIEYVPEETRAVAIHEAGHAAASHVYMDGVESTRLSIKKRGASLGHHQAREKDERFTSWRREEAADLIWGLGAMAAERVFYDDTSAGVGGDVYMVTAGAALMVGAWGMGPERVDLEGRFVRREDEDAERERVMRRFEQVGVQIMNRASAGGASSSMIGSSLSDPWKRTAAAQILGQAYVIAHHFIAHNKEKVARIADTLVERKELHGDEVVELLDSVGLEKPEIDFLDDAVWPKL